MDISAEDFDDFEKPTCLSNSNKGIRFRVETNDRILVKLNIEQNMWSIATVLDVRPDSLLIELDISNNHVKLEVPISKVSAILIDD